MLSLVTTTCRYVNCDNSRPSCDVTACTGTLAVAKSEVCTMKYTPNTRRSFPARCIHRSSLRKTPLLRPVVSEVVTHKVHPRNTSLAAHATAAGGTTSSNVTRTLLFVAWFRTHVPVVRVFPCTQGSYIVLTRCHYIVGNI